MLTNNLITASYKNHGLFRNRDIDKKDNNIEEPPRMMTNIW
jgi:hypothetical protein